MAPKLEKRPAAQMAFVEHRGAYDKIPFAHDIAQLYGWAKQAKVMPGFYPMGIYLDPPSVPAAKRRAKVAITYKGKARGKAPVKTGTLPEMTVATTSFRGPASEFPRVYAELSAWLHGKGMTEAGPAMEIYSKKPVVEAGVSILTAKIMLPVRRGRGNER